MVIVTCARRVVDLPAIKRRESLHLSDWESDGGGGRQTRVAPYGVVARASDHMSVNQNWQLTFDEISRWLWSGSDIKDIELGSLAATLSCMSFHEAQVRTVFNDIDLIMILFPVTSISFTTVTINTSFQRTCISHALASDREQAVLWVSTSLRLSDHRTGTPRLRKILVKNKRDVDLPSNGSPTVISATRTKSDYTKMHPI